MAQDAAELRKHIKLYWGVFGALAIMTVVTVGASHLETGIAATVMIALLIACFKGSLVAGFFMHLVFERQRALLWLLVLCAIFFAALVLLPVWTTEEAAAQAQEAIKSVS